MGYTKLYMQSRECALSCDERGTEARAGGGVKRPHEAIHGDRRGRQATKEGKRSGVRNPRDQQMPLDEGIHWYSASMRRAPDLIEGYVEGFGFLDEDVAKLFFLDKEDGLELDHFEDGEEGDDHGVAGGAGFEELNEADGIVALARIWPRSCAIICATVKSSCGNSMRVTSFLRSRTCWKTRTRSTNETTSSPSVPSSL